jgi:hypothetical protein
MRVAFVTPDLRRIDLVKSDAMCLCLHSEDWPLKGLPGLVDWRVFGHLSRLAQSGWITCKHGEVMLMPLDGRLPFERLFVIGMGSSTNGIDRGRVATGLHGMFDALGKLRIHSAVLHLPGRPDGLPADVAMRIVLDVAARHQDHDEIVLVEPLEAQQAMKAVLAAHGP